jgi:hypothetical protein
MDKYPDVYRVIGKVTLFVTAIGPLNAFGETYLEDMASYRYTDISYFYFQLIYVSVVSNNHFVSNQNFVACLCSVGKMADG